MSIPNTRSAKLAVREYVRDRKIEMDIQRREKFVPQTYAPAQEAQIDWFEGDVRLAGQLRRMQIFGMRSMYSGGAFHRAYTNATQQAFLEGHEHGFAYFGGVFHLLRFDNLSAAVKKILQGHQREETQRVIAFRSHWGFQSDYCNPGAGHEKGGVEGEVGRFRRNCLVPVPEAGDIERLNQLLLERCRLSERRTIANQNRWPNDTGAGGNDDRTPLPAAAGRPRIRDRGDSLSRRQRQRLRTSENE